jgi:DNA-binding transcriptional ArsR family regulator
MVRKVIRKVGRVPLAERKRQSVEAMTHANNHWIRVEALALLHEGEFSAGEIAEAIGEDVKNVTVHIHDLYDSGNIEFAGTKMIGNYARPVYRALVLPKVDQEVYRKMSIKDRHDLNGAVTQGITTEMISSYGNGKMDEDEDLYLVWDAMTLDARGEQEMHDYMEDRYAGAKEIQVEAAHRLAESGEEGVTKCIGLLAFRRGRPGRPEGGYYKSEDDE